MPNIQIAFLNNDAKLPVYATTHSAGFDLYSVEEKIIYPGDWMAVGTGIAVALDPWTVGFVCPRSGLAKDLGVTVLNAPGVIDADYRGEIKVLLVNLGRDLFMVQKGDRIAQMIILTLAKSSFEVVTRLPETKRGEGGFGHTGVR